MPVSSSDLVSRPKRGGIKMTKLGEIPDMEITDKIKTI